MYKTTLIIIATFLLSLTACSGDQKTAASENSQIEDSTSTTEVTQKAKHEYGGWYCPDNLNGFPAVDIKNWNQVPVVNGRMATKEETQNGTSLMYIDPNEYPNAKPLEMEMPQLGRYYNDYTKKNELIIIIQAVNIDNDSVVGFRYMNGGNGSAWLNEVTFLSEDEVNNIDNEMFFKREIAINADKQTIWEYMTNPIHAELFRSVFTNGQYLGAGWTGKSNFNFKYPKNGNPTSAVATTVWGNLYIQNDYDFDGSHYVEKILLLENDDSTGTTINAVSGPFGDDFEVEQEVWNNWLDKVKELSEKDGNK